MRYVKDGLYTIPYCLLNCSDKGFFCMSMLNQVMELQRIEAGGSISDELTDVIRMIAVILGGMKEERK